MADETYAHHRKEEDVEIKGEEKIRGGGEEESREKEKRRQEEQAKEALRAVFGDLDAKSSPVVVGSRGFAGVPSFSEFHGMKESTSGPNSSSGYAPLVSSFICRVC